LKPGGELRIAVPDFKAMNALYYNGEVTLKDIIGPLYGRMPMRDKIIYHKTTYDIDSLYNLLFELGYDNIERYDWRHHEVHRQNDDHSQAYLNPKGDKDKGTLISLNVKAKK
jgi:predicted SAM-dependent methyltransferase